MNGTMELQYLQSPLHFIDDIRYKQLIFFFSLFFLYLWLHYIMHKVNFNNHPKFTKKYKNLFASKLL